jgi:hypothetical protein
MMKVTPRRNPYPHSYLPDTCDEQHSSGRPSLLSQRSEEDRLEKEGEEIQQHHEPQQTELLKACFSVYFFSPILQHTSMYSSNSRCLIYLNRKNERQISLTKNFP